MHLRGGDAKSTLVINTGYLAPRGLATMPFKFEIDKAEGVIRETWTGCVSFEEVKDSCIKEWAHKDYRKRMPMISDFREATTSMQPKDAVQFALWFGDKDPPSKHAIVVARELGFGFAKMFALMSDAAKQETNVTRVFYSYDDAEAWFHAPLKP